MKEGQKERKEGIKQQRKRGRQEKAREERKIVTNISSTKGNIITSTEMKEEYVNVMSNFLIINPMILMELTLFKSINGPN